MISMTPFAAFVIIVCCAGSISLAVWLSSMWSSRKARKEHSRVLMKIMEALDD